MLSGTVHGGQQPVSGSTIQLYAVGTAGDGSPATPLISAPLTTSDGSSNASNSNANAGNSFNSLPAGSFTINGEYQCPSASTEVYLTSIGGNPGLPPGGVNHSLAMMAVLGSCGSLTASTYVSVNELTTVGSIAPLAGFMNSYSRLGSGTGDAAQFGTALAAVKDYTNTSLGTVPGPALPPGYYASSLEIQTLGDILAGCINSTGGIAGDGSLCGQIFRLTTTPGLPAPTDTIGAVLNILKYPNQNVAQIYNLLGPTPPYQPTLKSSPQNWQLAILPVTSTPVISPGSGSYVGTASVTISDATPNATIYYTSDGTTPSTSSAQYSGPIQVSSSTLIQAISAVPGYVTSNVASAKLTITAPVTFTQSLNSTTIFIGASIIQYWPMPLHNAGIAGQTTSQVLQRFQADVVGHGYARVVILVGTNDILQNIPGLPNEATSNLKAMAAIASQAGMEVVLSELPPLVTSNVDLNDKIKALNVQIAALAAQNSYLVVDYFTPMYGHPEYFLADGIHPNAAGYSVMDSELASVVLR